MEVFNAVDVSKWANVLAVVELLLTLPVSNGQVERIFSPLKLVKMSTRTHLNEDTLDQFVRITVEGPLFSQWNATGAINKWLADKQRRLNQKPSQAKEPSTSQAACSSTQSQDDTQVEDNTFTLEDWQTWVCTNPE